MAIDNTITISGNATRKPELRHTPSGKPVANLSVATNRRWTNTAGETEEAVTFIDVTAWGDLALNAAETIDKGARLVVTGRLDQSNWETDNGENRSRHLINADDIAPSLKWATAKIIKTIRDKTDQQTTRTTQPANPEEEPF